MGKKRKLLSDELQVQLMECARPLSRREYMALRINIGCLNAMEYMLSDLEQRLRECIPTGWREARMIASRMRTLFDKVLLTIPREKLLLLQAELPRYELYVRMTGAAKYDIDADDFVVLPRRTAMALVDYAVDTNCTLCSRTGKRMQKCKLARALREALPYAVKESDGVDCPFQMYGIDGKGLWDDAE